MAHQHIYPSHPPTPYKILDELKNHLKNKQHSSSLNNYTIILYNIRYSSGANLQHASVKTRTLQDFLRGTIGYTRFIRE